MRTSAPAVLPLFRSEMQIRLLALLLEQPELSWSLQELASALDAPTSSVHRELGRAEHAGIVSRRARSRPHRFQAAIDDPLYEPLTELLHRTIGVERQLRASLKRNDILAAVIHGSWASGNRRPNSDIDVLVVGDADIRELRRAMRPIGKATGRTIDLTVLSVDELRRLHAERSGFLRGVLGSHITLTGNLENIIRQ